MVEEQIEAKKRKNVELNYQKSHANDKRDVDLDFEYSYN